MTIFVVFVGLIAIRHAKSWPDVAIPVGSPRFSSREIDSDFRVRIDKTGIGTVHRSHPLVRRL